MNNRGDVEGIIDMGLQEIIMKNREDLQGMIGDDRKDLQGMIGDDRRDLQGILLIDELYRES